MPKASVKKAQRGCLWHSDPPVDVLGSRAYYLGFRILRGLLAKITNERGVGLAERIVSRFVSRSSTLVSVRIGGDSVLVIPASDSYWGYYLFGKRDYEPEVFKVLKALASVDYVFVDAGANFGYWSILVSSREFGGHEAIAIEASKNNFGILVLNAEKNANRFQVMHRCIAAESGSYCFFAEAKSHAASSVQENDADVHTYSVETISLSEVIESRPGASVIVKLDIEGGEVDAIKSLLHMLVSVDILILFESHQVDVDSKAIDFCLKEDLLVFWVSDDGEVRCVEDLHQAQEIKREAGKGYNFWAVSDAQPNRPLASSVLCWIGRGWISQQAGNS